jgi:hypothetical protein
MNAPTDKKFFLGQASSDEAEVLANRILDQARLGMATRMFSIPGDMNSAARLTLTFQLLEAHYPSDWQLLATPNYGLCLVSSNWTDD